ncbi:MAG: hypothetical protein PHP03_00400 [Candidatus Pacebacteria bacterium]|nr:hypothetical protein [Candidatus Paceibacterota bacterium]
MSFNRVRGQLKCESFMGCSDLQQWANYKTRFESLCLSKEQAEELQSDLNQDALDCYFKGLLSFSEAINSINRNLFSWSTVKLYYSVFYFLKCSLAVNGYALVTNKSLYLIKANENEKPNKVPERNSHEAIIETYVRYFSRVDVLQSNMIGTDNAYIWLKGKREQVNYREREFHEPECPVFWQNIRDRIKGDSLKSLLELYLEDQDYRYCFQEDHACLALPIKRAIDTKKDLDSKKLEISLSEHKKTVLQSLLGQSFNLSLFLVN